MYWFYNDVSLFLFLCLCTVTWFQSKEVFESLTSWMVSDKRLDAGGTLGGNFLKQILI